MGCATFWAIFSQTRPVTLKKNHMKFFPGRALQAKLVDFSAEEIDRK
jgi:hypothetical protein